MWQNCQSIEKVVDRTYVMIPPTATKTPMADLSRTALPELSQPRATIEQVFTCPTTVLETGPVCAMMKNCDMLIMNAKNPDYRRVSTILNSSKCQSLGNCTIKIRIHFGTATSVQIGKVSTNGMT